MTANLVQSSIRSLGSRTCDRRGLQKGLEPDQCYYIHIAGFLELRLPKPISQPAVGENSIVKQFCQWLRSLENNPKSFLVTPNCPGRTPFAPTVWSLGNRGDVIRIWYKALQDEFRCANRVSVVMILYGPQFVPELPDRCPGLPAKTAGTRWPGN
jgi:hypothetical protein